MLWKILNPTLIALALGLASCKSPEAAAENCVAVVFETDHFSTCTLDDSRQTVALAWKSASGEAFRSFSALEHSGAASDVAFAMNAGMFDDQGSPIGLYVENGRQLSAINLGTGAGNFYMQPNGVFWVDRFGHAQVSETAAYLRAAQSPLFATQSGPMLVIDGSLHPAFAGDGQSRYIRNGVGAACTGGVVFVITEQEVSFGKIARFFRDELQCRNALYLDGAVSSLWLPSSGRVDARAPLGPLVIVQNK